MNHLDVFMLDIFMCAAKAFHTYDISYAVYLLNHHRLLSLFFIILLLNFITYF
jgi:hypothetical protein